MLLLSSAVSAERHAASGLRRGRLYCREATEASPGFGRAVHSDAAPEGQQRSHVLQVQEADPHPVAGGGFLMVVPGESLSKDPLRSLDLGLVDGGADLDRVAVRPLIDERCCDGGQGLVRADPPGLVELVPRRDPFESVHPWRSGTVGDEVPDAGLGEQPVGIHDQVAWA